MLPNTDAENVQGELKKYNLFSIKRTRSVIANCGLIVFLIFHKTNL